jgi:DNA (cytosine-5)-methyltransferase 1
MTKKEQPTFIDLFSGIGGFRVGMDHAGFKHLYSNDWDKYASESYAAWYGAEKHSCKSIWDAIDADEIPSHDILCGGFPCQPFSNAGKRLGFKDNRQGNLFFAIQNIVESKRPKIVLLENVRTLKGHDGGNTFKTINDTFDELGYHQTHEIISAKFWVPQNRVRIFMVYFDKNIFNEEIKNAFQEELSQLKTGHGKRAKAFASIMEANPDKSYQIHQGTWDSLQRHKERHRDAGRGFGFNLMKDFSQPTNTLSARYAKDGAEILIKQRYWRRPRKITLNEAKNLMGFNRKYASSYGHKSRAGFPVGICSNTQSYKQFGNAVVPQLVQEIGGLIQKYI